jgi:replication factor C small subunit
MMEVWTEKYRPRKLEEVKGQEEVVSRLRAFVASKNFPHLLFAGSAGVGKTTCALAIAHELYGENWGGCILETNASDERGIDVIRTKIKDFAKTKAIENIPFKIIYLDECDALTKEAQDALRRIMEDYTQTVRFILSCNYSSKIIPPIQSRCAVFRFKPLGREVVLGLLRSICENEGMKVFDDALEIVYEASEGDMRKAENLLQACASLGKEIDKKAVSRVVSFAEPKEIREVVKLAIQGKFVEAKRRLADVMVAHGLSGLDVIKQIQREVWDSEVDEKLKVKLIKACGDYEFRLVEGSNEFIQLFALLAEFAVIGSSK